MMTIMMMMMSVMLIHTLVYFDFPDRFHRRLLPTGIDPETLDDFVTLG